MIIHVAGNAQTQQEDIDYLRVILRIVERHDVVALNWIETAYERATTTTEEAPDWETILRLELDAIRRADLVIIEATHSNYLQGYETAVALDHKKPVLIVSRHPVSQSVYAGIKNRMLVAEEYHSEDQLAKIVEKFIRDNMITTKDLRFNMFIDRPIHNYLRSVSHETGKNKSEIIRDLINREIEKKDS